MEKEKMKNAPVDGVHTPVTDNAAAAAVDPDKLFEEFEEKIKSSGHPMDLGRIRAAYEMARVAHSGQKRRDGSPYVTHCIAAADISVDMGLDEDSIIAALLHDVIEDTNLTHEDIARQFGCSDDAFIHRAEMFLKELWMPEIQPDGVLPQDDSFMAKPAINLAKYKAAAGKQTILLDYSRAEVNEMQILKQADVVMLNYMLPEQFSAASCLANLQFYEPRTIHDSSLSKAIHGIVAARCGLLTQSYQFWREGTEIDLGADPHSCDDGIHAAATGAIWLGAIQGFAGVSVRDGELHLNPALPEQWQQLSFPLFWQGCELQVTLDAQRIAIRTSAPVSLRLNGQLISVAEESVFCLGDFILPFNGTATTHQEDE